MRILRWSIALLGLAALVSNSGALPAVAAPKPIRVLIWDEQQPAQKEAYENFLGNAIADHLRANATVGPRPLEVKSVGINDPEQGITPEILDNTDVLIWWGHQRHNDVKIEKAKEIVRRIKAGQLQLIALHSAHFAQPFTMAMDERSIDDALKTLTPAERKNVEIKTIPAERRLARKDEPLTPSSTKTVKADGSILLEVRLPMCVFPVVRNDGKPGHLTTLLKKHPIAKGIPETFDIPQTEVYGSPFYVPTPDAQIFSEKWDSGETFPSGSVWSVGAGKVFYFRPGHETYPIFKQPVPLKIVENAVRWLGNEKN